MASMEDLESRVEPIGYLVRSPSRLKVLREIHEAPRSRRELKDGTDVSRVTLSRMLSSFEDRGWIERTNGTYEVTSEGAFVADELTDLVGSFDALRHLDGTMEWLPVEAFDFELSCLADAEVTTADWGDHTAQIRRVADLIPGSDRITATGSGVSRGVLKAMWEATVNGGAAFEAILDDTAMDVVRSDAEISRMMREILATDRATVRHYTGEETPLLMVTVCDDTVILCGHDEDGPPPGTLETADQSVRAWAVSYVDEIRADSTPVDPGGFDA